MNNVIEEAKRCLNCKVPSCVKKCPLGNDIPKIIENVKNQNYEEAFKLDQQTNPLGAICGLICPHDKMCEGACVRGIKGESVKIGMIESALCKYAIENIPNKSIENNGPKTNDKVAIIGGGPSGIACAYFLAKEGIQSTIFEKEKYLGGILKYGIPVFRLDKELVNEAISYVMNNNLIEVKYNHVLVNSKNETNIPKNKTTMTINDLKEEGYKYFLISIGKEKSVNLEIKGNDLDGVYLANNILRFSEEEAQKAFKDKNCVIIGGGNVAIDCCRFVLKQGNAKSSTIIYRRRREDMKANNSEIQDAENENVNFVFQKNVIKIEKNDNGKNELKLYLDDDTTFDTDVLIMAIGALFNYDYFEDDFAKDEKNNFSFNDNYESNVENIFFGGDIVNKSQTVSESIKTGRDVAKTIANKIFT